MDKNSEPSSVYRGLYVKVCVDERSPILESWHELSCFEHEKQFGR